MKRLLSAILLFAILFAFPACNDNRGYKPGADESDSATSEDATSKEAYHIDIADLAEKGEIPEIKVPLGTYVGTVKEEYGYNENTNQNTEVTESELDDFYYHGHGFDMNITNEDDYVKMDVGVAYLYYKSKLEGSGISRIVSLKNSYDFETGAAVSDDIKNAIEAEPVRAESGVTVDFLPAFGREFSVVEYEFDKIKLEFYFNDDFLTCTVLTDTSLWAENGND